MINLKNILTGWSRSMGLLETPPEVHDISVKRIEVCANCPHAQSSSFLKFIKGSCHSIDSVYCTLCKCPVNEKSLVPEEKCPLNKWENIQ